ncbi:MAG: DUF2298 domain-containing protein, partial [Anaerolineae bacterium]|nr:DUF2298 domain-containing protein [Anaerolineae bacterium]
MGLLIWGYIFWLLASFGVLPNTPGSILLSLIMVFGLSVLSLRGERFSEFKDWLRGNINRMITVEIIYIVAFGFWAYIRATSPEISGTEKPMEMAFINAILRSESFPPHDPWLSGYAISYYYFGYVMIAMITKLLHTDPGVAFNLASALWFGLTAVSAYGIGSNLMEAWRDHQQRKTGQRHPAWAGLGGFLTAFFILVVSNIEGLFEMLHARGIFWRQLPDGTWSSSFWSWIDLQELTDPPVPPFSWTPERMTGIWWWRASRVLQDFDAAGQSKEIIDEFPFFSYYLADLHPHVLAMPFALLAIAFTLNLFLGGWKLDMTGAPMIKWVKAWWRGTTIRLDEIAFLRWLRQPEFWLGALIFGGLAFLNTWDFPIYVALFGATLIFLSYRENGWSLQLVGLFLRVCIGIGVTGALMYLPFYLGFASQAGGIIPSIHFFTRGIHLWIMFLPLLVPVLFWFIWRLRNGTPIEMNPGIRVAGYIMFGLWLLSYIFGF